MSNKPKTLREKVGILMFSANTKLGRRVDFVILWGIILSVLAVMLESVKHIQARFEFELNVFEWFVTILFSVEYILRVYSSKKPLNYVFSFFGLVDLLSILPTYLGLIDPGTGFGRALRILRLLRIFRILKLSRSLRAADELLDALRSSRPKITVFLFGVVLVAIVTGTLMYIIEDAEAGFTSIPRSIYWAIVTLTTVGYGDISPATVLGQFLASMLMVVGYGIIAVPTGIVSAEYTMTASKKKPSGECENCHGPLTESDKFCSNCGYLLPKRQPDGNSAS